MKRIIAIAVTFVMLFSFGVSASASEWDFLKTDYYSYEATGEMYFEINKPMEWLSLFNDDAGFDVKYFVEELSQARFSTTTKVQMNETFDAAKMYLAFNAKTPLNFSEDLKIGTDVTLKMWVEFDFTSVENAKYVVIYKNPMSGKYMYMDLFQQVEAGLGEEDAAAMKTMLIETYKAQAVAPGVEELEGVVEKAYSDNATLKKGKDSVTVSFTNDSLVDMLFDLTIGVLDSEYYQNAMAAEGADDILEGVSDEDIAMAKAMVKGLGVFSDEDAMVIAYKLDRKGNVVETEEKIHLDFNIAEIMEVFGLVEENYAPLTKENSDVDLTVWSKAAYEKIGSAKVEMPVLTEENSENLLAEEYLEAETVEVEEYVPENFYFSVVGKEERGNIYVDAQRFFDINATRADQLKGDVKLDEEGNVTITVSSLYFPEFELRGNIRDDRYYLGEYELRAWRPFTVVETYNWETYTNDKKVYVSVEVLANMLGCKVESVYTRYMDYGGMTLTNPETTVYMIRPNMGYVSEEE